MQVFLPYSNYRECATHLDYRRLGKQRVETYQILNVLYNPNAKGWANHPAVKMWRGYEQALVNYGLTICEEWLSRGYKDTCYDKISAYYKTGRIVYPQWLGGKIHTTHRAALLFKDFTFYSQFGWSETPAYNYYWPAT